jgi:hypothetical protein
MATLELQYEPHTRARPVLVEHEGSVTRIIVPMRGPYIPIPRWISNMDVISLAAVPIWSIVILIVRSILRLPRPPRALFEISEDRFKITLHDTTSAEPTKYDWPRTPVLEARANRYDRGLWINAPGYVKDTILADLPRDSIKRLEAALGFALAIGTSE